MQMPIHEQVILLCSNYIYLALISKGDLVALFIHTREQIQLFLIGTNGFSWVSSTSTRPWSHRSFNSSSYPSFFPLGISSTPFPPEKALYQDSSVNSTNNPIISWSRWGGSQLDTSSGLQQGSQVPVFQVTARVLCVLVSVGRRGACPCLAKLLPCLSRPVYRCVVRRPHHLPLLSFGDHCSRVFCGACGSEWWI